MLEPKWIFDDEGNFQEIRWVEQSKSVSLTQRLNQSLLEGDDDSSLPKAS